MPIKKTTKAAKPVLGPKAKLLKLSVTTLRAKAKKLGISDVTKRTKENLAISIILGEARKKRGTAAGKKATAAKRGRPATKTPVSRKKVADYVWNKDGIGNKVVANKLPKVSAATKKKFSNQKAASWKDESRFAMQPGKRISKNGKVYYEYRRNRADISRTLHGDEKYNGWTNYWTWKYNLELLDAEFWGEQIEEGYYTNVYDLSKALEESADELVETAGLPDWAEFWILAAFSEVNWYEIAKGIAEDYDLPPNDL